jgi:hypothetical protein
MHIKYLVLQQFYRVTMLMAVAAPPFAAPVTKAVPYCVVGDDTATSS